ncbi:MAG: hydrogenase expression protein [Chloroflexi bacterium]|nr:hydrogenase expression protein [Chloroflexota bacterium]
MLAKNRITDPRVVLGPGVGEDAAALDMGDRLLVAKCDPITFATDSIGWYAVHVNANDIAATGAVPRWFLATLLVPESMEQADVEEIFNQIGSACRSLDIALIGGHTEITYDLDRPLIVGAMLGEVEREALVQPAGAREGDALILTKGIAIEGTAVLAREAGERLEQLGVPQATIETARRYIFEPGISVVPEALAACAAVRAAGGAVHAMHDPTEGGLATALYELAEASGLGMSVQEEAITVLPETQAICSAASLEPLGLLASGALLIAVAEEDCGTALAALAEAGIGASRIGAMVKREAGVIMDGRARTMKVPRFARDEVARFLAG